MNVGVINIFFFEKVKRRFHKVKDDVLQLFLALQVLSLEYFKVY